MTQTARYPWFTLGDLNAFFALFLDNVVNLVILAGILVGAFGFPEKIIFEKMIPGTALGVMIGDLAYTYMAYRLAKKTGRTNITAMPLGLDTPSTIGIAVAVLGPAYLGLKAEMPAEQAAMTTWYIGMATLIWMGLVKIIASFAGSTIQRIVPEAGLLGSLAGIGIVWLAADQFINTMEVPLVGMISLGLVLFTLIAHYRLPGKIPGAAAAVVIGMAIYYLNQALGFFPDEHASKLNLSMAITMPSFETGGFSEMFSRAIPFLPVAIPFGLLTVIGGINVTEGARLAGDNYKTRDILMTEAFATLIAGMFGGVSQSTPYIGHSAYKKMGARMGYTLLTGLLVGLGGMLGLIGTIVNIIPEAAVSPILIFVGFEITAMAYQMTPKNHNMAVTFAIIPSVLNFGYIKLKVLYLGVTATAASVAAKLTSPEMADSKAALLSIVPFSVQSEYPYLEALSQGYIVTAMIWGSVVAFLIDHKTRNAVITLFVGSVFSLFGIIHSATSSGKLYLPWELNNVHQIPYKFAIAYAMLAGFIALLSIFSKPQSPEEYEINEH